MAKLIFQTLIGVLALIYGSSFIPIHGSLPYVGGGLFFVGAILTFYSRLVDQHKILAGLIAFILILIGSSFTPAIQFNDFWSVVLSIFLMGTGLFLLGFKETFNLIRIKIKEHFNFKFF